MSATGRYCCKSPKLKSDNFPARRQSKSRSLIDVVSISLPKSPVSLSLSDEVPSYVYSKGAPENFRSAVPKRLLQQYRHLSDIPARPLNGRYWGQSGSFVLSLSLPFMTHSTSGWPYSMRKARISLCASCLETCSPMSSSENQGGRTP
jgi:hypothetical protein